MLTFIKDAYKWAQKCFQLLIARWGFGAKKMRFRSQIHKFTAL